MEKLIVFIIGAVGYSLLEVVWRGYTHWTMAVTGGVCFLLLYWINTVLVPGNLLLQCLAGAAVVTVVELAVGSVVNLTLHWNVWDYSNQRFHLYGQVCLLYSALWFLLCIPLAPFCQFLKRHLA